jgi:hypothetical protein
MLQNIEVFIFYLYIKYYPTSILREKLNPTFVVY